jgi:non-heme Fe2+,alpha-ketoglutarate-dependent halogenase
MVDKEAFKRDGIVFPAGTLDMSGALERYEAFQAASRSRRGKETYIKPHLVCPWLDSVARCPEIVENVIDLIGPDVVLWESDWAVKRAGTGEYVPWHQDSPYWNLSSDDVVTVWIALCDVTEENGAMEVVIGSHASGRLGSVDADGDLFDAYSEGQRTTDDDCLFPFAHLTSEHGRGAIPVTLKTGEYSIHHVNLVHGGGPNASNRDRVGFALRYMTADTRYLGEVDSVTAISGDCARDHFVLEPGPDGDFTDTGLAALERALAYPSGFGEAKRKR